MSDDAQENTTMTPEQYEAIIKDAMQKLVNSEAVVVALVQKAGGAVTLTKKDADAVIGHMVATEAAKSEDELITLRAVPFEPPARMH